LSISIANDGIFVRSGAQTLVFILVSSTHNRIRCYRSGCYLFSRSVPQALDWIRILFSTFCNIW